MLVVRLATVADIDAVYALELQSNGVLSSLPADKALVEYKINHCVESITRQVTTPGDELYFFVLEDMETKKIIGCSAINAAVGMQEPYYVYHISKIRHVSKQLHFSQTLHLLEVVNDLEGATELCSLYLSPNYRTGHYKELLSWSRLLFIAETPQRFAHRVFADIRGVTDTENHSVFWQHLGSKLYPMDFATAYYLSGAGPDQFIADLIPRAPIYMELLPQAAQAVIGQPHPASQAAMCMLIQQGFHFQDYVNILDGGPTLDAYTNNIKAINESVVSKVSHITAIKTGQLALVAHLVPDYRVILTEIKINEDDSIQLDAQAAKALHIQAGEQVRWFLIPS